ncbi:hypothetical protein JOH51_005061 [Rhizobium leguminosarum]|nr:hypothetical protein [Rhizobium leguminosarum]
MMYIINTSIGTGEYHMADTHLTAPIAVALELGLRDSVCMERVALWGRLHQRAVTRLKPRNYDSMPLSANG